MGMTKHTDGKSRFQELKPAENFFKSFEFDTGKEGDFFRSIIDKAFEGVAVLQGDKICFCNDRVAELTGRTREELQTISFIENIHPDDRALVFEIYTKRLTGKDAPSTYTFRIKTKDGEVKWIQATAALIKWEGQPASLGFFTDVSLQKKFEEDLLKSERRFRNIVSNSVLGIYETNLDGKICYLNDALLDIVEYDSSQELIGTNAVQFYKNKNERDALLEILKINDQVKNFQLEIVTKTGKHKFIELNATVFGDKIFGTLMDISDRKKTEIALKKSQKALHTLINATEEDIVLLIDPDGTVLSINEVAAKKYGSVPGKIIGRNVYEVMPPELSSYRKAYASKVIKIKEPVHYMGRFYKCSVYPIFYDQDKISSLAIFARDVTDLKLIEKELVEAKKGLEYEVKKRTEELIRNSEHLAEANTALKVLLEKRIEDKNEMEEKILNNVKQLVLPYLEKVKRGATGDKLQTYLDILETNLTNIISPFSNRLSTKYMNLTSAEIQVADLVKHGKHTKEIADLLRVSAKTVETHRVNIRKKLGLTNKRANLRTYLLSIDNG
jgi:PAS domain S-box-containing protein